MNERLIVLISEIILVISAIVGMLIVLAASWQDLRVIRDHKRKGSERHYTPTANHSTDDTLSIHVMPSMFKQLTVNIVNKALSWRKSYHVEDLAPLDTPDHPNRTHQTPVTTLILKCIGLIIAICLLTYFFYTAAILKSNTLLTLSWVMVSLWFAATIWSDETMATSKKYELTFTVPFMYFVFYVVSFAQLAVVVWKLLLKLKPSKMHWQKISDAIQLELYSTRY